MDLKGMGVGLEGVDWASVAQDRSKWQAVVNKVMNVCIL